MDLISPAVSEVIVELATKRGTEKTICPSEVARVVWPQGWRQHMDEVRSAAFSLKSEGKILILQKGHEIVDTEVKEPIRIKIR